MHSSTDKHSIGFVLLGYSLSLLILIVYLSNTSLSIETQPLTDDSHHSNALKPQQSSQVVKIKTKTSVARNKASHISFKYDTTEPEHKRSRVIPNFSAIKNAKKKKHAFINFFKPIIDEQNALQLKRKEQLQTIKELVNSGVDLNDTSLKVLRSLLRIYRIPTELSLKESITELGSRVNIIPGSMVIAQAASESAWGTSRFAKQANNFFGQWCFKAGCGIVPARRNVNSKHEIAKFKSAESSVRAYFKNLNTYKTYQEFRDIRLKFEKQGEQFKGLRLVHGLEHYSERGEAYIRDLQSIIRFNKLDSIFSEQQK